MGESSAARALLESDRLYFELGAQVEQLPCATLAYMPGLETVPSGCVVQVRDFLDDDAGSWLDGVERKLRHFGATLHRLYLWGSWPTLEGLLRARGYDAREEIGYLTLSPLASRPSDVRLRPVSSEADWSEKRALHERCGRGPDGYVTEADRWVELERRKCSAGPMSAFLIEAAGSICGAVCTMEVEGLLRLKNIVIDPALRRSGIATETVHLLSQWAFEREGRVFGTFAVRGGAGEAVYRGVGLESATLQAEWSRPVL